jgi:hypothetical protein
MATTELTPKDIDRKARENKSAASVRLTPEGKPIPLAEPGRKSATAMEAYAISTANQYLFKEQHTDVIRPMLPPVNDFRSVLETPIAQSSARPTPKDSVARVAELIEIAGKINAELYTPFMGAEGQILITQYVQDLIGKIRESLDNSSSQTESNPELFIFPQPLQAEIVDSVTRAFLYPLSAPVNQPDDFDSGNCDYHLNTSFRRGDRGHVVASSGQYVFFISDYGTYGWIDLQHTAMVKNFEKEQQEMFYTGGKPLFFEVAGQKYVVLPGDSVYLEDGKYIVKTRNASGAVSLQELPALNRTEISGKLDFSQPQDLQVAIDFLNNLQMPYMWSVFDCSEVMRRMFLLAGIQLPKYSGDMMTELAKISPDQSDVTEASEIMQLRDGVYVMNLLNPSKPKESQSIHMFLVVKKGGELKAFSYAFDIIGDEQVEQPIGPHVCGVEALTKQLAKGRQFTVTPIAA